MVIKKMKRKHTLDYVMDRMDPVIEKWFRGRFEELTEPQAFAIPQIHRGHNVLVSSPTGSGKTITAFLSIINELYQLQKNEELEDKIYCVYISPLKALANDINKNLKEPLAEISELAEEMGEEPPAIRVGVRSGDTSNYERQKMARKPPHIFITTPESTSLVLSTPKFSKNFRDVRYVIVDEIHEISSSKRGVFLSLSLERLQDQVEDEFTRIGLSATQAPISEIAKFLVGYRNGGLRDCRIVEADMTKELDLGIISPVSDMTTMPYEVVNQRMYDQLRDLVEEHRTTLVFTNTRSGTESIVYKLKEKGLKNVAAHHGSLSRETRLEVEDDLRDGDLKTVVTSTSLELGIDVGHIDLVCQIGSPKSVAKGIQRIGRSGHGVHDIAKGRFLVADKDDLVESAVLAKSAADGKIDRISILKNSLDVLSQSLVGMALERKWELDEAFDLVRRSYCYKDLPRESFDTVIDYLAGKYSDHEGAYARIWKDETKGLMGAKKGTRIIYYLNIGTIPEEANYRVVSNKVPLGKLSEKFVERLSKGDIFVLGGRTFEFTRTRGMTVFVKDAQGRRPTVPSWTGEMLPRSFDLSVDMGRFRHGVERLLEEGVDATEIQAELINDYCLDVGSATTIHNYFKEQMSVAPIPTHERLLIEGYVDPQGRHNLIFHFCYGRRANDALARAYAYAISQEFGVNVKVSLSDDNFMLTVPKKIDPEGLEYLVTSENIEDLLRRAISQTEMFKQRFRHCAMRAFMILRNFKGRDIPVSRQLRHAARLLESLSSEGEDFPVIEETFNEILHEAMDLENAKTVVSDIAGGRVEVVHKPYSDMPSPFAHNIVLIGASDMILMDDRSGLLRELQKQILSKVMSDMPESTLDPELVDEHYSNKVPVIESKDDIVPLMRIMGPMNVLRDKDESIYRYSSADFETLRGWATELIREGEIVSVWKEGPLWAPARDLEIYRHLYGMPPRMDDDALELLETLPDLDPSKAKRIPEGVRTLERAYVVGRTLDDEGELVFVDRRELVDEDEGAPSPPASSFDEALRIVLRNTLEFRPPSTIEEISVRLALDEDLVEGAIRDLGSEVSTIQIAGTTRYLLSRDKVRLQDRKKKVFGEREVRQFVIEKHFHSSADLEEYFENFYEANMIMDIFNRVEDFDLSRWWEIREGSEILEGRFIKNRVGFMTRDQADLMNLVIRRPDVNTRDLKVLSEIQEAPGSGLWDLVRRLEDDYPKDAIKECLDKLDHGLFVVRIQREHREWPTRNRYEAFGPGALPIEIKGKEKKKRRRGRPPKKKKKKKKKERKIPRTEDGTPILTEGPVPLMAEALDLPGGRDPVQELVERCVSLYGPVFIQLIRYHTGLDYDLIHAAIDRLENDGRILRINVVDGTTQEMFITPDDLEALEKMPRKAKFRDRLRVLSQYDAYTRRIWLEVANRFGDGWYYPCIKDGKLCGIVEMWNLSGCLEVREVSLLEESLLPELLDEMDRHLDFHRSFGTEVVRFKGALGMSVEEMSEEVLEVFRDKGYRLIQGMLVKGDILDTTFDREKVLSYILTKQHLTEDTKFRDTLKAIKGLGGLHSKFEIEARVRIFHPLRKYDKELYSCLAIPEYLTYCTYPDLMLYKAAKNRAVDDEMERALDILREAGALKRNQLQKRLGMDQEEFNRVIKDLYTGLYILKGRNSMYFATDEPEVEPEVARKKILRRIIENFGIISAEKIASYSKHEFKMGEIREHLREWEDEGWLVKGYLVEGDETLYWMIADEMEDLEKVEVKGERVLITTDPVAQYLSQETKDRFDIGTCYLVLKNAEIIGAFKATKRSGTLTYSKFIGDSEAKKIVQKFGRRWGLKVTEKKDDDEEEDDWDIMLWYEKRKIPGE